MNTEFCIVPSQAKVIGKGCNNTQSILRYLLGTKSAVPMHRWMHREGDGFVSLERMPYPGKSSGTECYKGEGDIMKFKTQLIIREPSGALNATPIAPYFGQQWVLIHKTSGIYSHWHT